MFTIEERIWLSNITSQMIASSHYITCLQTQFLPTGTNKGKRKMVRLDTILWCTEENLVTNTVTIVFK